MHPVSWTVSYSQRSVFKFHHEWLSESTTTTTFSSFNYEKVHLDLEIGSSYAEWNGRFHGGKLIVLQTRQRIIQKVQNILYIKFGQRLSKYFPHHVTRTHALLAQVELYLKKWVQVERHHPKCWEHRHLFLACTLCITCLQNLWEEEAAAPTALRIREEERGILRWYCVGLSLVGGGDLESENVNEAGTWLRDSLTQLAPFPDDSSEPGIA